MRKLALFLLVCVQIGASVLVRAQVGSACTDPIPFGKNYNATISGPCTKWYVGNTFDLPLTVRFYPENNSDPAPEIKLDLSCTPGVYEDPIACSIFCKDKSSYISLPYSITPSGKTDSEDHTYYELELGEFYRDQLLRAGISYNIEVFVEVIYQGGGSINITPDELFSQCMSTDKWLLLGVTRSVAANDEETYFVAPYANWTTDSVRYVWNGTQPATLAIGTTCDFSPETSDPHCLELVHMNAQDTLKHSNAKIIEMQTYAISTAHPVPGAMYYVKVVSDAPGTLTVEHIPEAELNVEAVELVYDQAAAVAANDLNTLYAIPNTWTSATRFDTPTDHIFKMYVGSTPEFGKQDAIATYQFNKDETGHWFGLTEADMTALWQQTTDQYLYVRFECSAATTVTPSAWTVSDCIGSSTPAEKNTTLSLGVRSKVKYRIYYNDWKNGNLAFTWDKTTLCKVMVSGDCAIGTTNDETLVAYAELKDDNLTYQVSAEDLSNWASAVDQDGYLYMRFYSNVAGQMTLTSTAPAEVDPEPDPDPEPEPAVSYVIADGESKNLSELDPAGTKSVTQIIVQPGGQLNVDDASIQIEELIIETNGSKSGQVHNGTNLHAQHVYLEYILTSCDAVASPDRWYAVSVPFAVEVNGGISRTCDDQTLVSGTDFLIKQYSGTLRASSGKGWLDKMDGVLEAGQFYMLGIDGNCNRWRFEKQAGQPYEGDAHIAYSEYASSNGKDAGWNSLANTLLEYMRMNMGGSALEYVVLYNNCTGQYLTRLISEVNLCVGQPFFMQTDGDGYFDFFYYSGANNMPALYAQRDAKPLMHFILTDEAQSTGIDHMYLTLHEHATADYTIGRDVARMTTDCKTAAQLWCTMSDGTQLSAHGIEKPTTSTTVSLELFAPEAGEYFLTLASRAMEGYEVELLHHGAWVATLDAQPVSLDLEAGNNSGYAIRISRRNIPTGIEDVQADNAQSTKVIINDHLYILRSGHMYDAQGKQVK